MLSNLEPNITMEQAITLRQMFNDFAVNFKTEFKGKYQKIKHRH